MKLSLSKRALRDYENLFKRLQKTADKQFNFLLKNINYPSLRAKKYDEKRDIWQARLSKDWRFYFKIKQDICHIITIIKHPK